MAMLFEAASTQLASPPPRWHLPGDAEMARLQCCLLPREPRASSMRSPLEHLARPPVDRIDSFLEAIRPGNR
jgi:hypothetical protein